MTTCRCDFAVDNKRYQCSKYKDKCKGPDNCFGFSYTTRKSNNKKGGLVMFFTQNQKKQLSKDQMKALRDLKKTFDKCYNLGIVFVGIDSELYWSINDDISHEALNNDLHNNTGKAGNIDTLAYKDSGGW